MKVLLVEDHALFRDGVSLILERLDDEVSVVCADSREQALERIQSEGEFSLILLDYNLPDGNGISLLGPILESHAQALIILLSAEQDAALIQQALNSGAKGFITKNSSSEVMLSAIKLVLAGGVYIPPDAISFGSSQTSATQAAATHTGSVASPSPKAGGLSTASPAPENYALTERQLDVLQEMTKGLSNKEIARELNMSPSTVKVHVAAILREFNVKNRTQAVTHAKRVGIVDDE